MEYSLVLGASGGIGKEFCRQLLEKGENLIISGRTSNKLELVKNELETNYKNAKIVCEPLDLENENDRREFYKKLESQGVIIKGLYYVSGVDTQKAFIKYDESKLVMQARVNFEATLSATNFALKNKAKNLKILIVSSACGLTPMPYFSEYSATKAGLIYFFKALKYELDKSVKITVLCPGSVPTRLDIVEDIKKQGLQGKLSQKSPSYVVKKALKALEKNKTVCVPGFYNKLTTALAKITPYKIQAKIIAKKFKNKEKDAF